MLADEKLAPTAGAVRLRDEWMRAPHLRGQGSTVEGTVLTEFCCLTLTTSRGVTTKEVMTEPAAPETKRTELDLGACSMEAIGSVSDFIFASNVFFTKIVTMFWV